MTGDCFIRQCQCTVVEVQDWESLRWVLSTDVLLTLNWLSKIGRSLYCISFEIKIEHKTSTRGVRWLVEINMGRDLVTLFKGASRLRFCDH